jgi:hypothetical protein
MSAASEIPVGTANKKAWETLPRKAQNLGSQPKELGRVAL